MNSSAFRFVFFLTILMFTIGVCNVNAFGIQTEYWHNFRGPNYNGTSTTAKPPTKWSEQENVSWKVAIPGKGSSSPVVWGDKLFLTTAVNMKPNDTKRQPRMGRRELVQRFDENGNGTLDPDERTKAMKVRREEVQKSLTVHQFTVLCIDRGSGKTLWKEVVAETKPVDSIHRDSSYASASPVVDGQHVYFNFGSQGLFCYDLDGKKVWERTDLGEMATRGSFGEGSSVALADDMLILPWDHEGQSRIEALDKQTGETVWKKSRDEPSNWATPRIVKVDGKKQIIHAGENFTRGYDLKTGEELWKSSGLSSRPVSSPVTRGKLGIFASARGGAKLNAYYLNKSGDISTEAAWKIDQKTPDCPSLLLSDNRLYFVAGNNGIVSCANADDGSLFFSATRLPGISGIYSSPVAADGKVYVTGRGGKTVVIADSEAYKVLEENFVDDSVDATLALADNQIFIRGSSHLYCIEQKSKNE